LIWLFCIVHLPLDVFHKVKNYGQALLDRLQMIQGRLPIAKLVIVGGVLELLDQLEQTALGPAGRS
jgi:hypothetical protein